MNGIRFEPAPTIKAHLSTPNGSALLTALPDSGADVSVAGLNAIEQLRDHKDNFLPSQVTPRTVSGHRMYPIGKLPVKITVGNSTYQVDLHIYLEVNGILLSWKACKGLNILPLCYSQPLNAPSTRAVTYSTPSSQAKSDDLIAEFPSVSMTRSRPWKGSNST